MSIMHKSKNYRDMIDDLVRMCKDGQGQIAARRVREGIWNYNANATTIPDQHRINLLMEQLSPSDRNTIANMMTQEVVTGVFETLKTMEQYGIEPFAEGYEGSAYQDFIGRLSDWDWPEDS